MDDRSQQGATDQEPSVAPFGPVRDAIDAFTAFGGSAIPRDRAERLAGMWRGRHQLTPADWALVWAYLYPEDPPK